MITCIVDYVIDPAKTADFERFAARWIELGRRFARYYRARSPDRTLRLPLPPDPDPRHDRRRSPRADGKAQGSPLCQRRETAREARPP